MENIVIMKSRAFQLLLI